jgi:hypothetical protein
VTEAQTLLVIHLHELGYGTVFTEHAFCEGRKWRFDIATPDRVAIEIEGGAWSRGRHTRGKGFIADMEKYNTATMMGWRVLRCTPEQVLSGEFREWLKQWLSK